METLDEFLPLMWIGCILAGIWVGCELGRVGATILLSIFLGPLGLLIVASLPRSAKAQARFDLDVAAARRAIENSRRPSVRPLRGPPPPAPPERRYPIQPFHLTIGAPSKPATPSAPAAPADPQAAPRRRDD